MHKKIEQIEAKVRKLAEKAAKSFERSQQLEDENALLKKEIKTWRDQVEKNSSDHKTDENVSQKEKIDQVKSELKLFVAEIDKCIEQLENLKHG